MTIGDWPKCNCPLPWSKLSNLLQHLDENCFNLLTFQSFLVLISVPQAHDLKHWHTNTQTHRLIIKETQSYQSLLFLWGHLVIVHASPSTTTVFGSHYCQRRRLDTKRVCRSTIQITWFSLVSVRTDWQLRYVQMYRLTIGECFECHVIVRDKRVKKRSALESKR